VSAHVPTVSIVTSSPDTVHTVFEVDVTETESPDVEVGAITNGVAVHARPVGAANVRV
jgi:hypothetical protein